MCLLVLIECNIEKIIEIEKKYNKKTKYSSYNYTYNVRQLQCRFAIEVSIYFAG